MINVYIATTHTPIIKDLIFAEFSKVNYRSNSKWGTWYQCKPTMDYMNNVYVFRSPVDVDYKFPFPEDENREIKSKGTFIDNWRVWENSKTVTLNPNLYLFSEEPLEVSITSPYMHNSVVCKKGFIVPAKIDINKWYRRMQPTLQLYPQNGSFKWDIGEPIFYLKFHTDEKINFIEYHLSQECYNLELERARWGILERDVKNRPDWFVKESKMFLEEKKYDRSTLNDRIKQAIDKSIDLSNNGIFQPMAMSRTKPSNPDSQY